MTNKFKPSKPGVSPDIFSPGCLCRLKPVDQLSIEDCDRDCWLPLTKSYMSVKINRSSSVLYDIGPMEIGIYLGHFPEMNDCDLESDETHQALFNEQRVWINANYFEVI